MINNRIHYYDTLSAIAPGGFYVIDTSTDEFPYVSPHNLLLCGYSVDEALAAGVDFHEKVIASADFDEWKKIYEAILIRLDECKEEDTPVDYFSCNFRLRRCYSFRHKPLLQMVTLRMAPFWKDSTTCLLYCTIKSSTGKTTGNLCLHNKDGQASEKYCSHSKKWESFTINPLTEREQAILRCAIQGRSTKEMADLFYKSQHTIQNQIKSLFQKLGVNSMPEAIEFASKHKMIYAPKKTTSKSKKQPEPVNPKKARVSLTPDM
jgi:DNA-binding CsgD family transcriptional regulator